VLSTCPACLNQILHEDGKDTISCECGETFSPFLTVPPEMDFTSGPLIAMAEKNTIVGPTFSENSNSMNEDFLAQNNSQDFSESEAAFAELRSFGETVSESGPPELPVSSPIVSSSPTPTGGTSVSQTPSEPLPSEAVHVCPITAGDELSGYTVDAFLPPISVWCSAKLEIEDPLKNAHDMLSQKATQLGANGVVSVRWSFTPDGSRILLTGTPVKCRKAN